jgi:hypothetical protein
VCESEGSLFTCCETTSFEKGKELKERVSSCFFVPTEEIRKKVKTKDDDLVEMLIHRRLSQPFPSVSVLSMLI